MLLASRSRGLRSSTIGPNDRNPQPRLRGGRSWLALTGLRILLILALLAPVALMLGGSLLSLYLVGLAMLAIGILLSLRRDPCLC